MRRSYAIDTPATEAEVDHYLKRTQSLINYAQRAARKVYYPDLNLLRMKDDRKEQVFKDFNHIKQIENEKLKQKGLKFTSFKKRSLKKV